MATEASSGWAMSGAVAASTGGAAAFEDHTEPRQPVVQDGPQRIPEGHTALVAVNGRLFAESAASS